MTGAVVGRVVVFGGIGGAGGFARLHMLIHMQDAAMDAMQNSTSKGGHMMRRIRAISSSGHAPLSFRVTMKKSQTVFFFFLKKKTLPPS